MSIDRRLVKVNSDSSMQWAIMILCSHKTEWGNSLCTDAVPKYTLLDGETAATERSQDAGLCAKNATFCVKKKKKEYGGRWRINKRRRIESKFDCESMSNDYFYKADKQKKQITQNQKSSTIPPPRAHVC